MLEYFWKSTSPSTKPTLLFVVFLSNVEWNCQLPQAELVWSGDGVSQQQGKRTEVITQEMSALKAARFAVREENTYCFPDLQVKIAQNKNIKIFFLKKKGGKGGEQ